MIVTRQHIDNKSTLIRILTPMLLLSLKNSFERQFVIVHSGSLDVNRVYDLDRKIIVKTISCLDEKYRNKIISILRYNISK